MIEMQNVTAGYGKQTVLHGVSAVFAKGVLTGVVGPNGSGKSTILKAITGILTGTDGSIHIDSIPLGKMHRKGIARRIAWLPQGKDTPDMTVGQLVLHGRFPYISYPGRYTAKDREIADSAMEKVGIRDLSRTPLAKLSGGMRQNAYIAMALAQDTDYILLDEPTTYLDIRHQMTLMQTLRELTAMGKGIVAVMHDLPMAMTVSDRIIVVENGRVVGQDVPEAVFESGILDRIFGITLCRTADNGYGYRYLQKNGNANI